MQQPQMTVIQRLNDAFATEIMKRQFPVDRLSFPWREAASKALEYASPNSLGVNAEIFMDLAMLPACSNDYKLSLFEFATLSNNLEMRSAKDLGLSMQEYVAIITEAGKHVTYYSTEIAGIRKEIEARIAAEDAAKKTTEGEPAFGGLKAEA